MQQPGFWNDPQKVMQRRSMILRQTSDRSMSQAPATPKVIAKPQTGIPTGVYIAGGIIVVAVIGIVAL